MMIGFLNGARIFESEGLQVEDLGKMILNIAPILGQHGERRKRRYSATKL